MLPQIPAIETAISIIRRRRWYFLVPFVVILAVALGVIMVLPATYQSTGTIGVEAQQIPEEFVRSTITTHAGERVGMVQARVMTAARLEQIIDRLQLYSEYRDRLPMTSLVEKLKENTTLGVISDPYATRLGAIAFTVAFEHEEPEMARAVAAELVDLFLAENLSTRTERAAETTEFLEREAEKLGAKARAVDKEIGEFKQAHRNALPEHLDLKISMVNRAESDLRSAEMEISSLQQEQRFLQTQRGTAIWSAGKNDALGGTTPRARLTELRAELAAKSSQYLPAHPEIRRLQAVIQSLERQSATNGGGVDSGGESRILDPALAQIDAQYHSVTTRLNLLRDQEKALRADIERLQGEILEIPLVEVELRRLMDKYNVYMSEYGEIRAKRHEAELAQSLEQEEKAERFILLEAPQVPIEPTRPLYKMLAFAAFASLFGGAAIAYLAEMLDERIYGRNMLVSLTGQQPLAVIPHVHRIPAIEAGGAS